MFWGLYGYVLSNLKSFIWCGQGENIETIYSVFKPCDKKCCSKLKVFAHTGTHANFLRKESNSSVEMLVLIMNFKWKLIHKQMIIIDVSSCNGMFPSLHKYQFLEIFMGNFRSNYI